MNQQSEQLTTHTGGCHCGDVRFEIQVPPRARVLSCNCSMCNKLGYLHLIVDRDKFKLLTPEENIQTYTFNTRIAQHYFCKRCGVKSFYVPRSHPDQYSVNVRCLDEGTFEPEEIIDFDGQNWEQARDNFS